jgi:ribosomal protein S18 acetylase RimI-like enzyme
VTTDELTLRRATLADLDAIVSLTHAAYSVYIARLGREPQPMTTDYAEYIDKHLIWLLERQQEVVGVLAAQHEPDALLIYSVAVHPNHQKRGLGRRLLAWAEHEARQAGYRHIRLYTNALMEKNIALYTRLGYHETQREPYEGGAIVHMAKELAAGDAPD